MTLAATLSETALAETMRLSAWTYPLVNAGHLLGVGLLIGSVAALDLRLLGAWAAVPLEPLARVLRPVAGAGLGLAVVTGALLFLAQAEMYAALDLFRAKMVLLALAMSNAVLHLRVARLPPRRRKIAGAVSLALWPSVLLSGRLIGYV